MKPLGQEEILDLEAYESARPAFRAAVIRLKARRRLAVGDRVTLLFENRETLRFQVQEMLRVERIQDPRQVQQELDVYNELVPGERELSATLFIEITERERIKSELDRLIGIDEHVALVLGEGGEEETIAARFDPKQMEADRIAAVQYVKFPLTPAQVERFSDPRLRARVRIDHPNYRSETDLPQPMWESLLEDLLKEPRTLLRPEAPGFQPAARDTVLRESRDLWVLRPAGPASPEHLVVQPRDSGTSLAEMAPERLEELIHEVRRLAEDLIRRHGSCRITVDADARPSRWHLQARPSR